MKNNQMERWKRFLLHWMPLIILISGVFFSSSEPYEKQDIRPLLAQYLDLQVVERWFSWVAFTYGHESVSISNLGAAGFVEFFIRKGAHFSINFLVGFFIYQALSTNNGGEKRRVLLSMLFAVGFASLDEIHQIFTPHRTPMVADVILDSVGAMCGIVLSIAVICLNTRRTIKKKAESIG